MAINIGGVKPIRTHFRVIEHDIVGRAIASNTKVRLELSYIIVAIPVGDILLMHESDALCREYQDDIWRL